MKVKLKKNLVRILLVLLLLFVLIYNTSCVNCYIPPIDFGLPKAVEIFPGTSSCSSPLDTSKGGLLGALITILFGNTNTTTDPKTIAVGNFGVVYYTIDGKTWIPKQIDATAGLNFRSIIYTGTRFIAAGGTTTSCAIYYSDKGIDWTKAAISGNCTDPINQITMGNGNIIGVGGTTSYAGDALIVSSTDNGQTWITNGATSTAMGAGFTRIVNDGTFNIALTNGVTPSTYRSSGTTFFATTPIWQPLGGFKSITCVAGDMHKIGSRVIINGTCFDSPVYSVYTIDSGTNWPSNATNIYGGNLIPEVARGMAMSGTRLVAVGDNCRVDYSDNPTGALNWNFNGQMAGCTAGTVWNDVTYDGSRFIAVGNSAGMGVMAISPTGNPADWTVTTAVGGTAALNAIVSK